MEKQFESYVDQELHRLESRINLFKQFKLLLNSTQLKGTIGEYQIETGTKRNREGRAPIIPIEYPKKVSTQKIRFVLNEIGRAATEDEILESIKEYEPKISKNKMESVVRAFRLLAHPNTGELLYFNYENSKYRFYIKNEWLSEDKNNVQPEFAPPLQMINDISIESIIPENIKWHDSK